jgi:hypothetical protein
MEEDIEVVNDTLIIRPYFRCSIFNVADFKYSNL